MKLIRLAVYISLGFFCSSLLIFFFGRGGLHSLEELQGYRDSLVENNQQLQGINQRLLNNLDALSSDPEQITLMARELGYYRPGERVIRIDGYRPAGSLYTVGTRLVRSPGAADRDWVFKLMGACFALLLYIWSYFRRRQDAHQKKL